MPIFYIFKLILFVVGFSLASPHGCIFPKSNNSQANTTHAPIKTAPPAKKAIAISMAQAKKNKEQDIKKFAGIGKYFFYQMVTCLMLNLNR